MPSRTLVLLREPLRVTARATVPLGELVVAAFDRAAQYTADPRKATALATRAVMRMLRGPKSPRR